MASDTVIARVAILLMMMLVGFIAKKVGILKPESNRIFTDLLIYITMPLLIISSYQIELTQERVQNALTVFIFGFFIYVFMILFAYAVSRFFQKKKRALVQFGLVFSNCAFMGFPVIGGIYGREGVFFTSIFIIHFNLLIWTYGVMLLTDQRSLRAFLRVLKNPSIVAIGVGMIIFLNQWTIPAPLLEAMDSIGAMTVPISMMMIGTSIASTNFASLFKGPETYIMALMRLAIIPLIVFGMGVWIGLPAPVVGVCTILSGMPSAANTVIFAQKFDHDTVAASKAVAFSTVASVVTIPLLVMLIHYIFPSLG